MSEQISNLSLGEVCKNVSRPFDFSQFEEVVFINTGDVFDGKFLHQNPSSKIGLPGQAKKKILKGDLLFSEIRPANKRFARVDFSADNFVVSTKFMVIRANSNIEANFLYLFLSSQKTLNEFQRIAESRSGTFPQITFDAIEHLRVPLLPIKIQKDIVTFIEALNDKIENNRRVNETLEEMAQAIFKSWFVDFDPVHAKAAGNAPAHMNAETAALFPSSFGDDGLPVDWSLGKLSDLVDLNPTERIKKGELSSYVEMANLPTTGSSISNVVLREFKSGTKFRNGDTLLARITPCLENGKTAYVDVLNDGEVAWGSTEYIVMRTKDPLPKFYSYVLARNEHFREHAIRSMTGTSGRQRAQADMVAAYEVVMPSNQVAFAFSEECQNWFSKIRCNASENQTLAELRDTLLPKLMSGEIRVADAEREVDAAV